jgi:ribonuclease HI
MSDFIIYTDGGSRSNPGPAASAFVVFDSNQNHLYTGGEFLGTATNNVAEYQGVILALKYLESNLLHTAYSIHFMLDSKLVVEQLSGRYKIKDPTLKKLAAEVANHLTVNHLTVKFTHIPRTQNSQADAEVNRILDAHVSSC